MLQNVTKNPYIDTGIIRKVDQFSQIYMLMLGG